MKTDDLQVVELPYEGERFAMVILMPGQGGPRASPGRQPDRGWTTS